MQDQPLEPEYVCLKPNNINEQLFDLGWKRNKPNYYVFDKYWNAGISYSLHIEDEWKDFPGKEFQYEYPIEIHINKDTPIGFAQVFKGAIENKEQLITELNKLM